MNFFGHIDITGTFTHAHAAEKGNYASHCLLHALEWKLEGLHLIGQIAALLALGSESLPCFFVRTIRNGRCLEIVGSAEGNRLNRCELFVIFAKLVLRFYVDFCDGDLQDLLNVHVSGADVLGGPLKNNIDESLLAVLDLVVLSQWHGTFDFQSFRLELGDLHLDFAKDLVLYRVRDLVLKYDLR